MDSQSNVYLESFMKTDICIVGAGPAGLMAAIHASTEGVTTTVVESNDQAGRKLLVTGGGRCNFTHDLTINEFVEAFDKPGRFLRHCFHAFSPQAVRVFFDERGIASVVEPDGCVFPATQRAGDIRNLLVQEAEGLGVGFLYVHRVQAIKTNNNSFEVQANRQNVQARRVILATGGLSWPQTGSSGDGYKFARALGHEIVQARPSLVPLVVEPRWITKLAGVSVAQVKLHTTLGQKQKIQAKGAMVFTQDGLGGPAAQDLSRSITTDLAGKGKTVDFQLDLCPTIEQSELDGQLREQFAAHPKKGLANILAGLVPKRLAMALCRQAQCKEDLQAGHVSKELRKRLIGMLKALPLRAVGTRPIAEAIVTRGGVVTSQIHPQTMESKSCPGLFFAGEVIDIDGPCGGYNLQMCFSTGALAGKAAAQSLSVK